MAEKPLPQFNNSKQVVEKSSLPNQTSSNKWLKTFNAQTIVVFLTNG